MPAVTWATPKESVFLLHRLPEYMELVPKKAYKPFWTRVRHEYFFEFPTADRFPALQGKQEKDYTEEERVLAATETEKRMKVSLGIFATHR